ncbi:MAG: methylenetetrahydrofolate--tRNA-(uracil(54)-C(5))-methyltransferase (FADH(2)-oxidizing) TrmFO [Armatimonadota bacterium]|nr:methylenetetrahydrofolate--tRNA-(uracil(54)-C(5))-methyltransferase (FADH(2)-oxidizing) TrmFO [Armatimonadota bacterium]
MADEITIIGGGLAGSEAAWQAANAGAKVKLVEMRPVVKTPVHQGDRLAELVCSNSLKSNALTNAAGLLKEEMRRLDSLIVAAGDASSVPAGEALAVDRDLFAHYITSKLEEHPHITIERGEVTIIDENAVHIVATGPLTSDTLAVEVGRLTGHSQLFFFDAVAPTIDASTIDHEKVFKASRYEKGEAAYLNCPFTRDEYEAFYDALLHAELAPLHEHEGSGKVPYFEGCLPIEALAARGPKTLCFGPMKPVGLIDPRTGFRAWAVLQLRQENRAATLYSMVGFQTRMKWGEQKRVFRLIPGLENAEFVRYGVIHRNTYIQSPQVLTDTLQMKAYPNVFFAGQITGVEGYVESAATGILAGRNAARHLLGQPLLTLPDTTMLGALVAYVAHYDGKDFQPMNSNWGIVPPLAQGRIRDIKEKAALLAARALSALEAIQFTHHPKDDALTV